MNLNELFFFKVFPCNKNLNNNSNSTTHNENNCYFYHISSLYSNNNSIKSKDRRREPIQFFEFFKKLLLKLKSQENYTVFLDKIFELKNNENNFNYYFDTMPIEILDEYISVNECCNNEIEFNYHINRYKNNICRFSKFLKRCNNKFCYSKHIYHNSDGIDKERNKENNNINIINNNINISKSEEIVDKGIINFRNIINKWQEKNELKFSQIINTYNYILSFENKYLSSTQNNKIKEDFVIFKKWYESNDNKNEKYISYRILMQYKEEVNLDRNSQIINNIYKSIQLVNDLNDLSQLNKNSNLLETLNINTNVIYISKYPIIKKAEIVKYVYAMINSSDGAIIYGGHENNNSIKGISLNRKERDKFKIWFNSEFIKILIKYEDNLQYDFYDLNNNLNDECVLVIKIKKIKSYKFLIKFPAKCLIIKEKFLIKNNNKKNVLLNEENIKECDLREYLEILRKKLLEHYAEKFNVKIS